MISNRMYIQINFHRSCYFEGICFIHKRETKLPAVAMATNFSIMYQTMGHEGNIAIFFNVMLVEFHRTGLQGKARKFTCLLHKTSKCAKMCEKTRGL